MNTLKRDAFKSFFGSSINQSYSVCSRWAVARRRMQDGCAYSLEHYPYIEGVLNSRAKKNWIMKGAQVGLTECGITLALFEADYYNRDVIYYFPTKRMGSRFSKTRISPAINLSPYLSAVCTNNSIEIKQFGNATVHILGANSMADLKGTAAGRLLMDELDEWTDQQIFLAEERTSGQKNDDTIIWGFSTPKYPNLGIHKQFLESTQEHYLFDCPHCIKRIELKWPESFILFGETVDDPAVYNSYLQCFQCKRELPHKEKIYWLKPKTQGGTADWEPLNPDADPNLSRGFYLPQLYSPTVEPYKIAVAYLRGHGDEAARREFYNSKLALPYIEDCYQVTDAHVDAAVQMKPKYTFADVKPKSQEDGYFTLGVDQGGPLHYWAAVRWEFDIKQPGDPNDRATGQLAGCGKIMADSWSEIHDLMREYQVRMCVIDYYPQPTDARLFARKFNGYVYLCQYMTGRSSGLREILLTEDNYGANLVKADKVGWLSRTLGRIMTGGMNLPIDLPLDFRTQLKAPVRSMKKVDGQYHAEFIETGPDHYAHALNYAEIALKVLDPSLAVTTLITEI